MALVYINNKKNGTTYVYDSINYWDKEKKNQEVNVLALANWMSKVI